MKKVIWLSTPLHASWYITTKCNLRCTHFYLEDYTKSTESTMINAVLKQLAKMHVTGVSFLGGEPLTLDNLEDIVSDAVSLGIKPLIATNGMLATKERALSLYAAGCQKFQVSLEGHSPELSDPVRGAETFLKILEGVSNLKQTGAFVQLNITISKQNYKSIPQIVKLADDVGADVLRLSAFIPFGTGDLNARRFMLDQNIVQEVRELLRSKNH